MATAFSTAREFVKLSYEGCEADPLTSLRLQRLLYYAQAWSFVVRQANLFPEGFQAWRQGPAVPGVHERSPKDRAVLDEEAFAGEHTLDEEEAAFVRAVWQAYRQYSASRLCEMAHDEAPWRKAWGDGSGNQPIPDADIADFFDTQAMPAPVAAHRAYIRERDRRARERMAARQPLDLENFASLAVGAK